MAIGHDLVAGWACTGGEPDCDGIRRRGQRPYHAGPGQRLCRGALAQPGRDQAGKYQHRGHQQQDQPTVERGTTAKPARDRAQNEARADGPGAVAHGRARRRRAPSNASHQREARAFPLMTTQIHTLHRPGLARHAGMRQIHPARIILHNGAIRVHPS